MRVPPKSNLTEPPFPFTPLFRSLLWSWDQPAHRAAALHSLRRMAEGGINDQLAGGFSRYSVDARWEIPHFEKMLYDSALLLPLYARAAALSGESHYRTTAEAIASWRSEERRVGKECVSTGRSRWSPDH